MSLEQNRGYLFREAITNPHGPQKSPWHVVITSVFPNRVSVTNPNNTLAGRAQIDELIETSEVPLLKNKQDTVKIPAEIIDKIVKIVEVPVPIPQNLGADPFES